MLSFEEFVCCRTPVQGEFVASCDLDLSNVPSNKTSNKKQGNIVGKASWFFKTPNKTSECRYVELNEEKGNSFTECCGSDLGLVFCTVLYCTLKNRANIIQ